MYMRGVIVILLLASLVLASCSNQETTSVISQSFALDELGNRIVPIDQERSTLTFTGKSSKESHTGTFLEWSGNMRYNDVGLVGAYGRIDVTSITTKVDALDTELKTPRLLDTVNFPVIEVESQRIIRDDGPLRMVMDVRFKNLIVREIIFIEETSYGFKSTFNISMDKFGISYLGINPNVEIVIDMYKRE